MDGISFRSGRPDDLEAIRTFTIETFEWGDYVSEEFLSWLDAPDSHAIVASANGDRPIGLLRVRMLSPKEAWLSGVRVHPDHRRLGVASELNTLGVEWARQRGADVIRLATEGSNTPARRQVAKLGYRSVAVFALAVRNFEQHGDEANGGRRPPGPERFDLAPAAEAEPAFMVWSTRDLVNTAHGLYAAEGWAFRRLLANDVAQAARSRQLWTCPSGWAIAEEREGEVWVPLLVTTADDAERAVRALVDLTVEREATRLAAMVPRVPWLEEALAKQHVTPKYPNHIYEKAL
jgi:ribosomal protein S18 acetylase RimI-like enzyme